MRLLIILAAVSTFGCTAMNVVSAGLQVTSVALDTAVVIARADRARRDAEEAEAEEARLARLREHSRDRMYGGQAPRCAVRIRTVSARTWKLVSCDGELKCWALTSDGYDCERLPWSAEPQL